MSAGYFSYQVHVRGRGQGYHGVAHAAYVTGQRLSENKAAFEAVPHAAYLVGQELGDRRGKTHRYGRAERVMHVDIALPPEAPVWAKALALQGDHATLWNLVEAAEKRRDAQIYRTVILSIDDGFFLERPNRTLDLEASVAFQRAMVAEHIERSFTSRGMIASWAIHWDPNDPTRNPHAHVMLTTRELTEEGFGKKTRAWNDRRLVEQWRGNWADLQNRALRSPACLARGRGRHAPYRVDHRSYRRQGIDLEAQPKNWGREKRRKLAEPLRKQRDEDRRVLWSRAERLIRNPEPVVQGLSLHFSGTFTKAELWQYAARFSATKAQTARLYACLLKDRELVQRDDGRLVTREVIAEQAKQELRPVLQAFGTLSRWATLDRALAARGWRMEAVRRDGRTTIDLMPFDAPECRVEARRVSSELSSGALRQRFRESRVRHELESARRRPFKTVRTLRQRLKESEWKKVANDNKQERESFFEQRREALRREWSEGHHRGVWTPGGWVGYRVARFYWERRQRRMEKRQAQRLEQARHEEKRRREAERFAEPRQAPSVRLALPAPRRNEPARPPQDRPAPQPPPRPELYPSEVPYHEGAAKKEQAAMPSSTKPMAASSAAETPTMTDEEYRRLLEEMEKLEREYAAAIRAYERSLRTGDREARHAAERQAIETKGRLEIAGHLKEKHEKAQDRSEQGQHKEAQQELHPEDRAFLDNLSRQQKELQKEADFCCMKGMESQALDAKHRQGQIEAQMVNHPSYDQWAVERGKIEAQERAQALEQQAQSQSQGERSM